MNFSESIPKSANFTVTIMNPLTFPEQFKGFWDVYGGLLAVVIPLSGGAGAALYKAISSLWKRHRSTTTPTNAA